MIVSTEGLLKFFSIYGVSFRTPVSVCLILVLALIAVVRWFKEPLDRKRSEWLLISAVTIIPIGWALEIWLQALMNSVAPWRPIKYDLYIYRLDRFFAEPSFLLGQVVWRHSGFHSFLIMVYDYLVATAMGTFSLYLFQRRGQAFRVGASLFLNGLLLTPFYALVPVSGPKYAFQSYPVLPAGEVSPRAIPINWAPNGIPSGHLSTAFLILIFLWPWRWGKIFGSVFFVLTIMATLGLGEHYLFDLLCGLVYGVGILWLVGRLDRWRSRLLSRKEQQEQTQQAAAD